MGYGKRLETVSEFVRKVGQSITDYSGYYKSVSCFDEVYPTSMTEASEIIQVACSQRISMRIRGNGHSLNGSSLPKEKELLLRSECLNRFQLLPGNQISVEAGVALWDLQEMLETRGYELQMLNGGFAAPTVGGFISAGGLGNLTEILGGFWDTVLEITLITGEGKILKLKKEDPRFPWIFGSMGQLGFIVEAKIQLVQVSSKPANNLFSEGAIPRSIPPNEKYCWFTLFSPLDKEEIATKQLQAFAERWSGVWTPKDNYRYSIAYRDFNPPLVFPYHGPFIGVGIWGKPKNDHDSFDIDLLKKMDADFHAVVLSEACFKRYIQTEMVPQDLDYSRYFGKKIYAQFLELKKSLDPHMLFNGETVFPKALFL